MYDGSGSSANMTGFNAGQVYDVRVYEYATDAQGRKLYRLCNPAQWRTDMADGIATVDDLEIEVYPNPAQDVITLSMSTETINKVQIQLLDLQGRQVANFGKRHNESGVMTLSLPVLPHGLYILRVDTENKIVALPVMINP
jgi:hypothetical protein